MKKSIFVDLDFFYEKFIYAGEDAEFYALVKKHGYKGKLVKEAKVYWKTPISWKEFLKQIRVYTVADLQIDSKTQTEELYASVFIPNEKGEKYRILNLTIPSSAINGIYRKADPNDEKKKPLWIAMLKIFPLVIAISFTVEKEEEYKYHYLLSQSLMRVARNLLRDVVGRYVGNEPESLFALEEIQKTAALMRFELERGNVDGFASLLDYHWELSKKVDAGSSNTLIEQIFSSIEELIDGKLVCGAGGGGFLQVILKKGVTRQQVEERLNEVFMDSLVGVADCRLVWE